MAHPQFTGYVLLVRAASSGLTAIPPATGDGQLALQNLSYAVQWWVFAAFGLFFGTGWCVMITAASSAWSPRTARRTPRRTPRARRTPRRGQDWGTRAALTRYRVLAYATGVFLLLLTLNIVLKYVLKTGAPRAGWRSVHGYLYLVLRDRHLVDLWFRTRLPFRGRTVLVVLAGTVPFMSFVAERWVRAQVQPMVEAEGAADVSRLVG